MPLTERTDLSREEWFEREALIHLIQAFEEEHYGKVPTLSLSEWLTARLERGWLSREQLNEVVGSSSAVSNILSGRRKASREIKQRLYNQLSVPMDVLLEDEAEDIRQISSQYREPAG